MVINDKLNLTMLCDFYELTMGQGYFATGNANKIAYRSFPFQPRSRTMQLIIRWRNCAFG